VADDNSTNGHVLQQTLSAWQMEVTLAGDGASAVAEFERAKDNGETYQLVILDALMAKLDGFETAALIRGGTGAEETKLLLLTSHGARGDAARCRSADIDGYLHKPIRGSDLQRGLLATMGTPAKARSQRRLVTGHPIKEAHHRILLAEDNLVNQRLAVKLLEKRGHSVVLAKDGREALDLLEHETFDLVLMDVQMPVLSGLEAAALIREKEKTSGEHIRIIALTANAMSGDREKCLAAGMDAYLSKPIRVEELAALL
jgi:two-component system sensor histidine kinase/response regulator